MSTTTTLPQLINQSKEVFQSLVENGGEISPELEEALAHIEANVPMKLDSYAFLLERLEMEEVYWKAKADQFARIAKGCSSTRDFLKERIKLAAQELNVDSLLGNDFKFTISNGKPSVDVVDESILDRTYFKEVVTHKLDKKKIEEDLKLGLPVAGAVLKETKALRISPNKKVGA